MQHLIEFPQLGLSFTLNRVAFNLFGKDIYWYGIIIAIGFIVASFYLSKKTVQFGYKQDTLYDLLLLCLPIAIICARLYYVIFEWEQYKDNPISALYIWNGGLAIYGGIIGSFITIYLYGKKNKLNIAELLDIASCGIIIGQIFGRWGNFVNAEAFGGETSLPWGMSIDGAAPVHPTFFYESLWNLIGFIILHFCCKHRNFKGQIFLIYVAWYGFGRSIIEGLRTDSLYIPSTPIRVSQLLAFISWITACILLFIANRNKIQTLSQIWNPTAEIEHKK
ncbi:MAG TPA: prolipoprotein diacylglyceryl transferase [Candidatus Butyricicoccus avistercoris]|uniref:Phosphatidylglycerol--prolipoprotein diacylglyceryl transferase n=1 Tax=Candidatus Butyricicoccus avistercoris TaxID=2838518 RepID=A0A9D1PGC4_9FIRM|nr:prolipoprotein diacylglyceryl transferase [Candidatus Butyricicoccus avistercoris]